MLAQRAAVVGPPDNAEGLCVVLVAGGHVEQDVLLGDVPAGVVLELEVEPLSMAAAAPCTSSSLTLAASCSAFSWICAVRAPWSVEEDVEVSVRGVGGVSGQGSSSARAALVGGRKPVVGSQL